MGRRKIFTEEESKERKRVIHDNYRKLNYKLGFDVDEFTKDPGVPGIGESGSDRSRSNLGNGARRIMPKLNHS